MRQSGQDRRSRQPSQTSPGGPAPARRPGGVGSRRFAQAPGARCKQRFGTRVHADRPRSASRESDLGLFQVEIAQAPPGPSPTRRPGLSSFRLGRPRARLGPNVQGPAPRRGARLRARGGLGGAGCRGGEEGGARPGRRGAHGRFSGSSSMRPASLSDQVLWQGRRRAARILASDPRLNVAGPARVWPSHWLIQVSDRRTRQPAASVIKIPGRRVRDATYTPPAASHLGSPRPGAPDHRPARRAGPAVAGGGRDS